MSEPLFDENTFLGYSVDTRLFWVLFTLMMVFFTSPVAHLPFMFGYGLLTCFVAGVFAVGVNLAVPLLIAHRSWRKQQTPGDETVLEFRVSREQ